jgi:biotin transporter BioY
MKNDGYMIAGACIGILTGTYLEVRYVKFETDGTILQRIIRVAMGIPVIALFLRGGKNSIYALIGPAAGHVVVFALMSFYIIFVYPALFTAVRRRLLKKNETAGD